MSLEGHSFPYMDIYNKTRDKKAKKTNFYSVKMSAREIETNIEEIEIL